MCDSVGFIRPWHWTVGGFWFWPSGGYVCVRGVMSGHRRELRVFDEMMWLTACRNCTRVRISMSVVPVYCIVLVQTRLYALVIEISHALPQIPHLHFPLPALPYHIFHFRIFSAPPHSNLLSKQVWWQHFAAAMNSVLHRFSNVFWTLH